jgi:hypothetical protein
VYRETNRSKASGETFTESIYKRVDLTVIEDGKVLGWLNPLRMFTESFGGSMT